MTCIAPDVARLPAPLDRDEYRFLRRGVFDDPEISVWVNSDKSFAFLDPLPSVDYATYVPRVQSLKLQAYKKQTKGLRKRLTKISSVLSKTNSILEIGASDAAFLAIVKAEFPMISCCSVEPDQNTRAARDVLPWLLQMPSLAEAINSGIKTDIAAMFHVFEHIIHPAEFLTSVRHILEPNGLLLIEVPSLSDPLLTLYKSSAYENFYFQHQHPYVYSAASVARVLEVNGFTIEQTIPYQRYGIENHLHWMTASEPGGNLLFGDLFASLGDSYRDCLEGSGMTDTIIVLAKMRND